MKRVTIFDQGIWWFGLLEWASYIQNRKQKDYCSKSGGSDL